MEQTLKKIGKGATATVYRLESDGFKCVMKVFNKSSEFLKEVTAFQKLRGSEVHVVRMLGYDVPSWTIFMEYI